MIRKLLTFTAISAIAATAAGQVNSPLAPGYTSRGAMMYENLNYIGSIDQSGFALKLDPDASDARKAMYYQAMSAANRADSDALDLLERYLAAYPAGGERQVVALAIADVKFAQGRYADALRDYRNLTPSSFDSARAAAMKLHQGFCLLKLGDFDAADAIFASLADKPRYANEARFYQGYVAYAKHDYKKAAQLFKGVDTSVSPGNMADFYLSQIYFSEGDFKKAAEMAKRLLRNHPKAIDRQYLTESKRIAGESLYELGQDDAAINYLKQYAAESEAPLRSALYILGVAEYRDGEYQKAINTLTPVTDESNAIGQSAYLFIGQSYMNLGNVDAATMAFSKASQLDYDAEVTETAFYNYAVAKTQGGRLPFGSSVTAFEEFLNCYPNSRYAPQVQEYLVTGYLTDNDYDKALSTISSVKHPSAKTLKAKQQALYNLGVRDVEEGSYGRAIERLQEAAAMTAQDPKLAVESQLWLGQAQYETKQYDAAAQSLDHFIKRTEPGNSNLPLAYYDLGYTRFAKKQYADALAGFNKFVRAPGNATPAMMADAYNRIGDCHYHGRDFDKAASAYDEAYRALPSLGDYPKFQQAMMDGYKRNYKGKITDLSELIKAFPQSGLIPSALLEMADAQSSMGDKRAALATYGELVESYPSTAQGREGYLLLAIGHIEQGNRELGIRYYKEVIERYPTSQQAQVAVDDLKRLYADMGELPQFAGWLANVKGAPTIDPSEIETLTYQSAEREYASNGSVDKLSAYVAQYPQGRDVASALLYLATDAKKHNNMTAALSYATQIVTEHPHSAAAEPALLIKGDIEYAQGKGEIALTTYRMLEERASTSATRDAARMGQLKVYRNLGQHDNVIEIANKLLSTTTNFGEKDDVAFARGFAQMNKEKWDEAASDWLPLSKNPSTEVGAKAAYYLAQMQMDNGNLKGAKSTVTALIDSNTPQNYWLARGYILLSDIHRKQGNTFEANEYLKSLRDNYPGDEPDIKYMIESRLK